MRIGTLLRAASMIAAISLVAALGASSSGAAVQSLETFKTEVDVSIKITQRSIWDGIYPGCFAPQEKFDQTYSLKFDSKPGRKSKIRAGTTTLFPSGYGTTFSYGDKGSLKQSAKSGPWELQVANPTGCSSVAPAPPAWATSPTCKRINERVVATVVGASGTSDGGRAIDGSITLLRVARPKPTSRGAIIGASCARTLHNVYFGGIDQSVEIGLKDTVVQIPVQNLRSKLERIAGGAARSRPSFKVPFRLGGDCNNATMSPSTGNRPNWTPIVGSLPHQALGHIFEQTNRSVCMVSGSGSITVRRVGATRTTLVPAVFEPAFALTR